MQYHLDGFRTGDPDLAPAAKAVVDGQGPLPELVDVLIVGSGPAGSVLAAQLAAFPDITTRIIERRDGPLLLGQADGVACRSVEMFEAFGLSERLLRESSWITETVFWGPADDDRGSIVRKGRVLDVEEGLSEFPHVIVNQARIQQYLLDFMEKSPRRLEPDYGLEIVKLQVDDDSDHPVIVTVSATSGPQVGEKHTVRARYVVGCDGARSIVRQEIGQHLAGDSARQLWGVMDVLAVTDLPDIRYKMVIQSAEAGNIVVIPREGGYLVRYYIELGDLANDERVSSRNVTADTLIDAANRILAPYSLDVREVAWWSAYEVGQRLTARFDDAVDGSRPRVFIAGDACHTHSPKAGQGMNVSMQDGFNLGWKLAAVLTGRADAQLLQTYSVERHAVAEGLIEFDKKWSRTVSARPAAPGETGGDAVSPADLQRAFAEQGRYTAGMATHYPTNLITAHSEHQALASGFPIGERFHSAPVRRVADARRLELGHIARADGRWRLYAFADAADPRSADSALRRLADYLIEGPASPIVRFRRAGDDIDAVLDIRAILQQAHDELTIPELPSLFAPRKGPLDLIDYEKAFSARVGGDEIYELRGIDRSRGALVLVRPDQYVAHVLPLEARDELGDFFAGFLSASTDLVGAGAPQRK